MKELSIEQKAKRYDELLVKLQEAKVNEDVCDERFCCVIDDIVPELKENEDEKIMKALIDGFKDYKGWDEEWWNGVTVREIIAWLEKQCKSDNNDTNILNRFSFYSYKDEPNILYLSGLYVNDEYRNKGIGTKILKVANEVAASMKCNSIRLKTEKGSHAEKLYRENGYTTILGEEENQIWLEKQGEQKSIDNLTLQEAMDIAVAKCFDEQKPNTDFSDLRTWKYIVDAVWTEKEGIGQYLDSPFTEEVAKKLQKRFGNIKQKPAWGEEDKKMFVNIKACLRNANKDYGREINWLKSIKPYPKQEWSEKDEHWIQKSIDFMKHPDLIKSTPTLSKDTINWLKSLKDRYTWKPSEEQLLL